MEIYCKLDRKCSLFHVCQPVSVAVKNVAIGVEGLGFVSQNDEIGQSAASGSSSLRRFLKAVLPSFLNVFRNFLINLGCSRQLPLKNVSRI